MNYTDWVGYAAGFLTTFSFLPQAVKTWQTRSAQDFSWPYLAMFGTGVSTWDLYGFLKGDLPIILANTVTIILFMVIVVTKALYPLPPRSATLPPKPVTDQSNS